jgi:hypothetical protein
MKACTRYCSLHLNQQRPSYSTAIGNAGWRPLPLSLCLAARPAITSSALPDGAAACGATPATAPGLLPAASSATLMFVTSSKLSRRCVSWYNSVSLAFALGTAARASRFACDGQQQQAFCSVV